MKKYILFDTSIGTTNMGDYIIMQAIEKELSDILESNFCIKLSTHNPVIHFYQNHNKNVLIKYSDLCAAKFICGTNILYYNMFRPLCNWNVNLFNYHPYSNSILVGCGNTPNARKINLYTKLLLRKILSKNCIHSVRDDKTKKILEKLGFNAINTGCPTLWSLTREKCLSIPKQKAQDVIFTLTDYCKDSSKDQKLIDILNKNYQQLYFWVQGSDDLEYLNTLKNIDKIIIVSPNLNSFEEVLNRGNIDYIGTRLHAGIFALQHNVRSIILAIDNRARDMKESYNLNCIERDNINSLENIINSEFETMITINTENVNKWKAQFINGKNIDGANNE